MVLPAWVRRAANHPFMMLGARVALGVVALGLTATTGYIANVNATIEDIEGRQITNAAATSVRFENLEGQIAAAANATNALSSRVSIGREDGIDFQDKTTDMLVRIIEQNAQLIAGQSSSAATIRSIEGRLTRLENQRDTGQ